MGCHDHMGKPRGGPPPPRGQTRGPSKRRVVSPPAQRPAHPVQVRQPVISPQPTPQRPPPAVPRRARPGRLTPQDHARVDRAAKFCVDAGLEGWPKAVASQVTDCLTPKTWNRLFGKRRQGDRKVLANIAKELLDGDKALRDFTGSVAGRVAGWLGGQALERSVAKEIAQRIPLPVDQKTVVVARGLQMSGTLLCVTRGIALSRCQCFID